MAVKKVPSDDKLLEKITSSSYHIWDKQHSSKQVVSIIYTLGEKSFAAASFEGLELFRFR